MLPRKTYWEYYNFSLGFIQTFLFKYSPTRPHIVLTAATFNRTDMNDKILELCSHFYQEGRSWQRIYGQSYYKGQDIFVTLIKLSDIFRELFRTLGLALLSISK